MGISGLLPALKSIQVVKSLSDFKHKNVAVDAYVWLHKGAYGCAVELAMGKSTTKYVDYAMHRVRLLRHFGIEPYIVFDGGPLPAKSGTEDSRKQKREECLAQGKAFAAQGKHHQARECFTKCVDVTPQMAYQLIKALKAEGVCYVVAPYEADAQLAYLERIGLVDAILTEDSDLLVFGCKNVLVKLDTTANTVISISRSDFASVCDSGGSISLFGWSDVQFRTMAILSGCDYLPSIPGIGLKRACTLLRKWKTVEQVVRALMLDGKAKVPNRYIEQFRLAEKCFLHQRVYSPLEGKLVHLTEVDADWDEQSDKYVGRDLDSTLAKAIATGNVDPVTLLPMSDINPGFKPRALKPIPGLANTSPRKDKGRGKAVEKPNVGGILSFFGPNPAIPRSKSSSTSKIAVKAPVTGKASGKRTLANVMDREISERTKRLKYESTPPLVAQSKFFSGLTSKIKSTQGNHDKTSGSFPVAGPSHPREDKENVFVISSDSEEEDLTNSLLNISEDNIDVEPDASNLSMMTQHPVEDSDLDIEEPTDTVEQEDGYISPTHSCALDAQELSSPPRPGFSSSRSQNQPDNDDFEADVLSSPVSTTRVERSPTWCIRRSRSLTLAKRGGSASFRIFANEHTSESPVIQSPVYNGPNLLDLDRRSDIECSEDELEDGSPTAAKLLARTGSGSVSGSTDSPTPSPATPLNSVEGVVPLVIDVDELSDYEEQAARTHTVMTGWKERWSLSVSRGNKAVTPRFRKDPGGLKRSETNVTPLGRHSFARHIVNQRSAPAKFTTRYDFKPKRPTKMPRNSMRFSEMTVVKTERTEVSESLITSMDGEEFVPPITRTANNDSEDENVSRAQQRLMQFRYLS